jgi:outer membrane protein assembly factor BamB
MKTAWVALGVVVIGTLWVAGLGAQDWPQWRGPHRDAKATGFVAPKTWPAALTKKWQVTMGEGVATPALVDDKLYVFTRHDGQEITRCLDAATGKELWQDKYAAQGATGPAARFSGPRSSPTVIEGKVLTLGVRGTLSCLDAATGKELWRKDDFKGSLPRFFTACSPLVVGNLCIVQLGGEEKGGIVAYDLASGDQKWKWTGDGTAYGSPVVLAGTGTEEIVAETAKNIVGISVADGKLLWQTPFVVGQRRSYNAATPIVDASTVIYSGSGRGTKAIKVDKEGDGVATKEVWSNKDNAVQFNTPVLKDSLVFGISDKDSLFCIKADTGQTAWTAPIKGQRGYGSIVDAGSVLLALTPSAELIVFEPNGKEFKQLAKYKVATTETYAYPVVAGNRLFIKDRETLTLWTID